LLAVLIEVAFAFQVVDTVEDAINYILEKECVQLWYCGRCHQRLAELDRGLFTAGWFGVREKYCSSL